MTKQNSNTGFEAPTASSEMERIFREGSELERQGKLDTNAIERIDAQMRAVSEQLDKELTEKLAEIEACHPLPNSAGSVAPIHFSKSFAWMLAAILTLGFVGVLLEMTIGEGFIFSHANGYREARPLMLFILIPAFALLWFPIMKKDPYAQQRYPTGVIRWGIMFPLMAIGLSAMVYAAPLGWIALCGWTVGDPSSISEAKIVLIQTPRKGCKLKAKIEIRSNTADVCLDGRIAGRVPEAGEAITVKGKTSLLGVYIDEVRSK